MGRMPHNPDDRWSWAEIDLGAIRKNVRILKNLTKVNTKFMAVVKADAYGHGAVPVAKAARDAGADCFGVATVKEGIELREGGIKRPIILLAEPPRSAIDAVLEHDIYPAVYNRDFALELGERAVQLDKIARINIKVDTGMNRIGVNHHDVLDFVRQIDFHRGLEIWGTFTHFATADMPDDWDFRLQLKRFNEVIDLMRESGFDPGIVHAANSAATVLYPEAHFDMVRCGIALYGLQPVPPELQRVELHPAMSIRARATCVKRPAIGEGVSYGLTYRVPKHVQIATLPLGYADGLRRSLSNHYDFIFAGNRVRQVGRICMDQCMVEIDANTARLHPIPEIHYGDTVTIVGKDGAEENSLEDMAVQLETNTHELACTFGRRLDRIYV